MAKVELLGVFGDDLMVVNAARISHDRWHDAMTEGDYRLISRLARKGHTSPFYHPQMQFRVTAPFYVAAQLKRHHVGLAINEVSRRYTKSEPEYELPEVWRQASIGGNPQVSGDAMSDSFQILISDVVVGVAINEAMQAYRKLIDWGVAPEQARVILPVATLTTWLWTGSLFAYAKLCRERLAPDTQPETAAVAREIDAAARQAFPASWTALVGYPGESVDCLMSVRVPCEWAMGADGVARCVHCKEAR